MEDVDQVEIAQRRPGRQPQRHRLKRLPEQSGDQRSTKAGASAPATRGRPSGDMARSMKTLNEGRGVSPSDTREPFSPRGLSPGTLNEGRGVSPSDTGRFGHFGNGDWPPSAQRRPGRQPQRHCAIQSVSLSLPTGAQRRPGRQPQRHMWAVQSAVAKTQSAQRRPGRQPQRHLSRDRETADTHERALNEGRGVSPSDTSRTRSAGPG